MTASNRFPFRQDLFDYPNNDFKNHLISEGNDRILFSGKFGIGKSFFLDHFFKDVTQEKTLTKISYNSFHIYPVNYSIASTEDVFRYIKYDVITLMLQKEIQLKESDLSYLKALPKYLKGNPLKVLATLIYMIPKVGKDVYESYEKIEELKKDFLTNYKEQKDSEGDKLVELIEEIENKEGSIFENNIITKLISTILQRLKQETSQENVLIIDDLDRIDPEHIFRLLNVFAAHLDNSKGLPNKLGFDKIIIVCDINNLRNIFKAKYGGETDFNGYIDKFYSHNVYHFDNRKILSNISYDAFKNIQIAAGSQLNSFYQGHFFNVPNLAIELLQIMISQGLVSLRTLITKINNGIEINTEYHLQFDALSIIQQSKVPLFIHFKILKEIVGGYDILKDYLNSIPPRFFILLKLNIYCNQFLHFIYFDKTFRVHDDVLLTVQGKELYLRPPERVERLDTTIVYLAHFGVSNNPIQYNYSVDEFIIILNNFIDLLKRIEN